MSPPRWALLTLPLLWSALPPAARAGSIHPAVARCLADAEAGSATDPASGEGAPVTGGPLVLWVTLRDEGSAEPGEWPAALPGCEIIGRLGASVEARVPRALVRALAARRGVLSVGFPPRPVPLARSEGLEGMRAPEYWSRFGTGEGARLGIIDVGFTGYDRLLGSELPEQVKARSFYFISQDQTDIGGEGEDHGTAVAEIAHDVAPGAEIYLANAGSPIELQMAVDWMVDQGVEVISHSVGWPVGIGDGTGPLDDIVASATRQGILWVNAAGNFAQSNWSGPYLDADGDRVVEVDAVAGEAILLPAVAAGQQLSVWLLWDLWPTSPDLSFEIDLLGTDSTILATSQTEWGDWPYAFRPLAYRSVAPQAAMSLRVRSVRGDPEGHRLRVVRLDDDLAPASRVGAGSVAVPADAPEALAVGAFAWSSYRFETYSSYGPTLGGLDKPEILGPDGVETATFRSGGEAHAFYGTSAACPHVAGAVALLLSAGVRGGLFDGRFDRATVLEFLRRSATPIETPYPDGSAGWGRVRLPIEPLARPERGPRLVATGYGEGRAPVLRLLRASAPPGSLRMYDVSGRRLAEIAPEGDGDAFVYRPERAAGAALARGRYWAIEPATGARAAFFWPGRSVR